MLLGLCCVVSISEKSVVVAQRAEDLTHPFDVSAKTQSRMHLRRESDCEMVWPVVQCAVGEASVCKAMGHQMELCFGVLQCRRMGQGYFTVWAAACGGIGSGLRVCDVGGIVSLGL